MELGEFALSTYREDNGKPSDLEIEDIEENLKNGSVDIDWIQTETPLDVKIFLKPLHRRHLVFKISNELGNDKTDLLGRI